MNNFESILGEAEARQRDVIQSQTWGHLFPKKGKHRGYVVFAQTGYGQTVLIDAEFEQTNSSPWLYNALNNMIFDQKSLATGVYIWKGYCYTEKVLVREPYDVDDEPEYKDVVRLEGKVASQKSLKELLNN